MSAYSQVKRQKVREVRPGENVDYFQGIDKVEYNNMAPVADTGGYRFYSGSERLHSRPMDDWLKISLCLADFRANGYDAHTRSPHRPWDDGTNTLENHKRCIKAFFDLCAKLGVRYWSAFDSDLGLEGEEARPHWEELLEFTHELSQRSQLKLLWMAPDLHSHPRYASGAFTSDASTFAMAAAQTKRCIEAAQRLGAECVMIWPRRERCRSWIQTDVSREVKLFAKMLKIVAEYKDRINYRCQLLLMPYHSWHKSSNSSELNDLVDRYMWDVTSCLYLLRSHSLERHYRVCAPPGHHALMASVYNMLGGVMITNDVDQLDSRKLTFMMKCIIDQGTPPAAGVTLRLRARSDADARETVALYVRHVDAIAKGLRFAASLAGEQAFSKHMQQRYSSFCSGFGSRLVGGDVSMEECEDFYKKNQSQPIEPVRHESTELMLQRYLDSADHI